MTDRLLRTLKTRRGKYLIRGFIVIAFLSSFIAYMYAHQGGITGQTNLGCTCHGSSNSATTVTVSAQSGSFTVQTGSTSTYTISVSNSSMNYYGIDIAVKTTTTGETNVGTLAVTGSDLWSSNGELTHVAPKFGTGGTTFTFTWTAPSTAGTYYLRAAGNAVNNNGANTGDQWNFMTVQSITVVAPTSLTLTSPNGGESWCAGSSRNVTWTSNNVTSINVDLSTDGGSTFSSTLATNITASAGSWAWNIPSGQAVRNSYRIRISDASNQSLNSVSAANFSIAPVTAITSQPQSVTICSGLQAQLSVTATGSNLSYQWRKDGTDVSGATSATLSLNNVQTSNSGSYTCVVTGTCGQALTSNAATLTVEAAPQITVQPSPQTVCSGQIATLSVTATGVQLTYQWQKDGTSVSNGTTETLTINNVKESDAGNYTCVISGKCQPAITSSAAKLTVNSSPSITVQPKPITPCESSKAFLYVTAQGSGLTYIWMKNGADIPNTNNDTLFFKSISTADAGYYSVKISGTCSPAITSGAASVTVTPLALITMQPESQTVSEGNSASFTITADGQNISYQWFRNSAKLAGKTTSILSLTNVSQADAGKYFCELTNSCGIKYSDTVTLSVIPAGNGPVLTIARTNIDFGYVKLMNRKEEVLASDLINTGNKTLTITGINVSGTNADEFGFDSIPLPITLEPGQNHDITVWFKPKTVGDKTASLEFTSNSVTTPKLHLSGKAAIFNITTNVTELEIKAPQAGQKGDGKVTLTNNSSIDITFTASLNGADTSLFKLKDNYKNIVLNKGLSMDILIEYNPDTWLSKNAVLAITVTESGDTINIPLTGSVITGVESAGNEPQIVYPNPVNDVVTFNLNSIKENISSVRLYEANGRKIIDFILPEDNRLITWDLKTNDGTPVFSGAYFLIIQTYKQLIKYPVVIIR